MNRTLFSVLLACSLASPMAVGAQNLNNTQWRAWYPDLKDTVTLSFSADSSAIISSTGARILLSTYKISHGILTFTDYGGLEACPNLPGSYHPRMSADTLVLVMDEDPCDGRGNCLIAKRWVRRTHSTHLTPPAPSAVGSHQQAAHRPSSTPT